jgi:hypothetical protein
MDFVTVTLAQAPSVELTPWGFELLRVLHPAVTAGLVAPSPEQAERAATITDEATLRAALSDEEDDAVERACRRAEALAGGPLPIVAMLESMRLAGWIGGFYPQGDA